MIAVLASSVKPGIQSVRQYDTFLTGSKRIAKKDIEGWTRIAQPAMRSETSRVRRRLMPKQ
jgi:hypothetical protein